MYSMIINVLIIKVLELFTSKIYLDKTKNWQHLTSNWSRCQCHSLFYLYFGFCVKNLDSLKKIFCKNQINQFPCISNKLLPPENAVMMWKLEII